MRTLPHSLSKPSSIQRVVRHLDQPVGQTTVEPSVIALGVALCKRLQGRSEGRAAFGIEHAADPQHSAFTRRQAQGSGLGGFGLLLRIALWIDGVPVVMMSPGISVMNSLT